MRRLTLVLAGWLTGLTGRGTAAPAPATAGTDHYTIARQRMVAAQLAKPGRDITNARVLAVMGTVQRHEFVPERLRPDAYNDQSLPIGHGQTISQPYLVAFMTERLEPKPTDRVLEIGTGSGYQAAVLAGLVAEVYTIEIINDLAQRATADLKRLGCTNVHVRAGDGYQGWAGAAPVNFIIRTCAPATATRAGPRLRRSILSSSRARRSGCRSRLSTSSRTAAASLSRSDRPGTRTWCYCANAVASSSSRPCCRCASCP